MVVVNEGFGLGPLRDIHQPAGMAARAAWWNHMRKAAHLDQWAPDFADHGGLTDLAQAPGPDEIAMIWCGANANEQILLRAVCHAWPQTPLWISEVITERGIGQGASLVIFVNIVATLPQALGSTIELAQSGDRSTVGGIVVLVIVFLATILGIIFVQEGNRRIPIVSAKRQVGGANLLAARQSYLPLKLNVGGVMPIIFASAVVFLPLTVANMTKTPWLIKAAGYLSPNSSTPWLYALLFFGLICGFSFFYASLAVNPIDIATNLKRSGVAVPGVRPGSATALYLGKVQNRLTLLGGLFLGAVAIIPSAVESATQVKTFQGLGATSLLILVGVAIDTAKQVQTYVISQRYEGMVRQ
jgi:preprotein translocase subunit SecY